MEALVVTHGHFDHLGFAERARAQRPAVEALYLLWRGGAESAVEQARAAGAA